MRIVISILMFIVGAGCVAYGYFGSLFNLAGDAGQRLDGGDEVGAFQMIIDFIMAGDVPRMNGFLFGGLFLIVIAIIYLIVYNPEKDDPENTV